MLINVPQYIDVEDKVAGPLTVKQLLWMIAMAVTLFVFWSAFPKPAAIILAIPTVILFVALAFYKPYGQPLGSFLLFGIMYFFRPKFYVWKRTTEKIQVPQHVPKVQETVRADNANKEKLLNNLGDLAKLLDSGGAEKNEQIVSILKKREAKK